MWEWKEHISSHVDPLSKFPLERESLGQQPPTRVVVVAAMEAVARLSGSVLYLIHLVQVLFKQLVYSDFMTGVWDLAVYYH